MMTCGCARINGVWSPCRDHAVVSSEQQVIWLKAENDKLLLQIDRMRKALEDFRDNGLRCDLTPSMEQKWGYGKWCEYLGNADERLRERAARALEAK